MYDKLKLLTILMTIVLHYISKSPSTLVVLLIQVSLPLHDAA